MIFFLIFVKHLVGHQVIKYIELSNKFINNICALKYGQ